MVKDGELASIDDDDPIRQGNTLAVVMSPNLKTDSLQVSRLFAALATRDTTAQDSFEVTHLPELLQGPMHRGP